MASTFPTNLPSIPDDSTPGRSETRRASLFAPDLLRHALKHSFVMLRPDLQWTNPVMFTVEVGTVISILFTIQAFWSPAGQASVTYLLALDFWLALTVLFANFATSLAEARGKAQADSLRKTRRQTPAYRLRLNGSVEATVSTALQSGDRVVIEAGQVVPGDGEIVEGIASVDESAITGESAPVIREAGGDRSGVTGGTLVLSDRIVVQITASSGNSFLDRMIALVEGAIRQRTPNEIALSLVLAAFTIIFLIVTVALWPMAWQAETYMTGYLGLAAQLRGLGTDVPTLVALLVCLIPTTIGALLAAIGIAGMDPPCVRTFLPKAVRPSKWPAISTRCYWTRPERLRLETGTRLSLFRRATTPWNHLAGSPNWLQSPTQLQKARASLICIEICRKTNRTKRMLRCQTVQSSSGSPLKLA